MANFKIGDKVRIADGITGKDTGIPESLMKEMYGKVFTVDDGEFVDGQLSRITLIGTPYLWSGNWLTLANPEEESDLTEAQWEDFITGELFVNCPTECAAETFMKKCEQRGLHWTSGEKTTSASHWEVYGRYTVYDCTSTGLSFCERRWYENQMPNIPIVSFTKEEPCRADCTVIISTHGDTITVRYIQDNCIISEETMTAGTEDSLPSVCHAALNQLFPEETFSAFQEKQESQPEWTPKFQVGDIVEVIERESWVREGMRGVVKVVDHDEYDVPYGVDFGSLYSGEGHGIGDTLTTLTGWWMKEDALRKIR